MSTPNTLLPSTSLGPNTTDKPARAVLNIDWKPGMPAVAATVKANTDVVFKWSGFHNVYMFPNKADFENCDFTNAQELAWNDQNSFTFKAATPGIFYFGCEVGNGWHCRQPQKLALTVTGTLYACVDSVHHTVISPTLHTLVRIMHLREYEIYA